MLDTLRVKENKDQTTHYTKTHCDSQWTTGKQPYESIGGPNEDTLVIYKKLTEHASFLASGKVHHNRSLCSS